MSRYAALLRGVNVGGIRMKMADLAELVRGLGYDEVTTVLASGNVLFTTSDGAAVAKERLEAALRKRFDYEAWVHVLGVDAIREIIAKYPFERGRTGWHDYVIFAETPEARQHLLAVELDPAVERTAAGTGVVYWAVPKGGTLDSGIGRAQSAARFKQWLTTRNVNTLEKVFR